MRRSAERTAARADNDQVAVGAVKAASTIEDRRFADFDADLLEEQTIRAEWAKAVSDGAIDIGSDSILKAIDDAERETQGAPVASGSRSRSIVRSTTSCCRTSARG